MPSIQIPGKPKLVFSPKATDSGLRPCGPSRPEIELRSGRRKRPLPRSSVRPRVAPTPTTGASKVPGGGASVLPRPSSVSHGVLFGSLDFSHFWGLDHCGGKQKAWTCFGTSTQEVSWCSHAGLSFLEGPQNQWLPFPFKPTPKRDPEDTPMCLHHFSIFHQPTRHLNVDSFMTCHKAQLFCYYGWLVHQLWPERRVSVST